MEKTKTLEENERRKSEIVIPPAPNYDELPQTDDVKTNKKIKRLSKCYPEMKFSDLLDEVRGVTIEYIIENM